MIDPEILLKVQKRIQEYRDGDLIPNHEVLQNSNAGRILKFDLDKAIREFEFADEDHSSPDYQRMIENLHERIKHAYKIGIIIKNDSKDKKVEELENIIKERDLTIEAKNKEIFDLRKILSDMEIIDKPDDSLIGDVEKK